MRDCFTKRRRHSARGVSQELLVRLYEAMQIAVTSEKLPEYINPLVYATMIAGIMEMAQDNVDPLISRVKRLRFLVL